MGGIGSGRPGYHRKIEDMLALDVRQIHKAGGLEPGRSCAWSWTHGGKSSISIFARSESLVLKFRSRSRGGEWEDMVQEVQLTRTPCHFGGSRPWFACPRCGRRVAVLYGGSEFLCRHCQKLNYHSQAEPKWAGPLRRADKLRAKLGGGLGMGSLPTRPKKMHQTTYRRIVDKIIRLERDAILAVVESRGLM